MQLIAQADVVLALGTRLNPFSTLPGYGIDYWPANAAIIQVDINPNRIGLTKPVRSDRRHAKVAGAILSCPVGWRAGRAERRGKSRGPMAWARNSPRWTMRTTIRAPHGTNRARAGPD